MAPVAGEAGAAVSVAAGRAAAAAGAWPFDVGTGAGLSVTLPDWTAAVGRACAAEWTPAPTATASTAAHSAKMTARVRRNVRERRRDAVPP